MRRESTGEVGRLGGVQVHVRALIGALLLAMACEQGAPAAPTAGGGAAVVAGARVAPSGGPARTIAGGAAAGEVAGPSMGAAPGEAAVEAAAVEPAGAAEASPDPAASLPVRNWQWTREDDARSGTERERVAIAEKSAEVQALLGAAGVDLPLRQVLFRVFKEEKILEVWASDRDRGPVKPVAIYRICAASGDLGPKRAQGDAQVPEGFYTIDFFKPRSDYYMAFHVDYPNRRDRALGYTGSAIMIHGRCASIGCLAMSDERIQELWVFGRALTKGRRIQVHIYPRRDVAGLAGATEDAGLRAFWSDLAAIKARFDDDHTIPKVGHDAEGRYRLDGDG